MTTASLHPENNEVAREQLIARGWAALPASYRMPANPPSLAEARAWCKQLAESHYENFHVASWFLPEALRPHFHAIYAYCRISDDLGDEVGDTAQSLALLDFWGRELDACYEGRARHPVFVALAETIRAVFHSEGALRRSAYGLSSGSGGYALPDDAGCSGLLPVFGKPCRQARFVRMRLFG